MYRHATFYADHTMRDTLVRIWDPNLPLGAFIGCNPGQADDEVDDATARKYVGFAKRWCWGGYVAGNIYQYVATQQADLGTRIRLGFAVNTLVPDTWLHDLLGWDLETLDEMLNFPGNRCSWLRRIHKAGLVEVCLAWGNPPSGIGNSWTRRIAEIQSVLVRYRPCIVCAGITKSGSPVHLSRYGYTDQPKDWSLWT